MFVINHIPSGRNLISDFNFCMYDSTLYEYVQTDPDENLDVVEGGHFCSSSFLALVFDDIKIYQYSDSNHEEWKGFFQWILSEERFGIPQD